MTAASAEIVRVRGLRPSGDQDGLERLLGRLLGVEAAHPGVHVRALLQDHHRERKVRPGLRQPAAGERASLVNGGHRSSVPRGVPGG